MEKYEIWAGVWNAHFHGIYEFHTREEADTYAYQLAREEYESYEGSHGILSFDECKEDAIDSWGCEDWTAADFQAFYNETIENTVSYYAKKV